MRARPAWDIIVLFLMSGGLALAVTGFYLALRRVWSDTRPHRPRRRRDERRRLVRRRCKAKRATDRTCSLRDAGVQPPRLRAKEDGQGEAQPVLHDHHRRRRHRVRAPDHRHRRIVEGRIARPSDDARRQDAARLVELEAHEDFRGLCRPVRRIALVPVEVSDQLLLPGRPRALCAHADPLHRA